MCYERKLPSVVRLVHLTGQSSVMALIAPLAEKYGFRVIEDASHAIGAQYHLHTQPYDQQFGFKWGDFPEAEQYYREAISIPLYYGLTEADQDRAVKTLREILR